MGHLRLLQSKIWLISYSGPIVLREFHARASMPWLIFHPVSTSSKGWLAVGEKAALPSGMVRSPCKLHNVNLLGRPSVTLQSALSSLQAKHCLMRIQMKITTLLPSVLSG